jgi:hypothetical protein
MLFHRRLRDLPRRLQNKLREGDSGTVAEELVADELGATAKHRPDRAEWYDVVRSSTGAKTEVKSCWARIGDEFEADGRFRLRRDQTRSLRSATAAGTAWYAFVVFDEDAGTVVARRARISTVSGWVRSRGGWNRAGHSEFDRQHKLPNDVVFSTGDR